MAITSGELSRTTEGENTYWNNGTKGALINPTKKAQTLRLKTANKYVDKDIDVLIDGVSDTVAKEVLGQASLSSTKDESVNYTPDRNVTLTSGGTLYVNPGYTDGISITLNQLLDGDPEKTEEGAAAATGTSNSLLSGAVMWNAAGEKLTGTIETKTDANVTKEADGSTVTVTIPAGYYASETIVEQNIESGSASVDANQTISVTGGTPTKNGNNYDIAVSGSKSITATANPGYIESVGSATVSASGTVSIPAGEITNTGSNGTQIGAGNSITIGAGYYPEAHVYSAQSASSTTPADKFSLSITDKDDEVTVGEINNGVYPITVSLTGTMNAGTAGYFNSGSATDSNVKVGTIPAGSISCVGSATNAVMGDYVEGEDTIALTATISHKISQDAGYIESKENVEGDTIEQNLYIPVFTGNYEIITN